MIREITGIVIKEQDYKESSKIINILTGDEIISVIAKGSRKLKSDTRNSTTKLSYGTFNIIYKENNLSTLTSVDVINNFKNIRRDITKISYASFLLELATQVFKQNQSSDILNLLIDSLIKIDEGYDPLIITNIIELKYLDYLGVMPIIDECALCGSKTNIATISGRSGGYVCNKCLTNEKIVSSKTIKLLRMFFYVEIGKISKLELSNEVKNEINNFLDDYYDKYTGLYLKTKTFLKNLNNL